MRKVVKGINNPYYWGRAFQWKAVMMTSGCMHVLAGGLRRIGKPLTESELDQFRNCPGVISQTRRIYKKFRRLWLEIFHRPVDRWIFSHLPRWGQPHRLTGRRVRITSARFKRASLYQASVH